ncbi:MAG: hypothetical protein D3913_04665 [Candidatus Electrothrix sp. LOE1_4_5]|nr:hypothetical protein [Candidatus Electrothrix gigas]
MTAYWQDSFDSPYFERQIDYYKSLGVNAIEFVPTAFQAHMASDEIETEAWKYKTISNEQLRRAIIYAHEKGLKVNLKPHIEPYPESIPRLSATNLSAFLKSLPKGAQERKELLRKCYQYDDSQKRGMLDEDLSNANKVACKKIIEEINPAFLWRARITPENSTAWFASYKKFLLGYLKIALDLNVEVFTVGTELVCMTRPKDEYLKLWTELIEELKKVRRTHHEVTGRSGSQKPLFTYATHENEIIGTPNAEEGDVTLLRCGEDWAGPKTEDALLRRTTVLELESGKPGKPASASDVAAYRQFWELFDAISITAYFKLGTKWPYQLEDVDSMRKFEQLTSESAEAEKNAQTESLRTRWASKLNELERWRNKVAPGKPVILAELGYRSVDFGHYKPYLQKGPVFSKLLENETPNLSNQENAYQAAIDALSSVDWVDGIFLWQEEIQDPPQYSNIKNTTYSLIGKPAAFIIEEAFTGKEPKNWNHVPACYNFRYDLIDRYDFDIGGGSSLSREEKDFSSFWTKAHVRPLSFCIPSNFLSEAQLGLWTSGAWGDGKDVDSTYLWDRYLFGVTSKLLGKGKSWDLELGVGQLKNSSTGDNGRYKSRQTDDVFYLFSHMEWRLRDEGYRCFPKTELDFEGVWSFDTEKTSTWQGRPTNDAPLDHDRMELLLSQSIYDVPVNIGNAKRKLRLTPAVTLGHVWQNLGEDYWKGGFGLTIGLDEHRDRADLATARFQYKEEGGEQWEGAVWIDIMKLGEIFLNE